MVPAIKVENLSKLYRIGAAQQRHDTLRDALVDRLHRWRRRGQPEGEENIIWALKDVSFEVQPGEVLGIIGRNGAGKSTLLKILSRITEPTSGRAVINGRVGSLLEVGTGFHPELTGRENIYLNGAILGMTRREIDRKFDEIVAFAEIEKFLDTPVKRYSSGMYVRLAFAVAAHLEPEILLVDEVLAVGDAAFQKKCLGKMGNVAKSGKTVLFVSHNMVAILNLCARCIYIDQGTIGYIGITSSAIDRYLDAPELKKYSLHERRDRTGNQQLIFCRVMITDSNGNELKNILSGQDIRIRFYYRSKLRLSHAEVCVSFVVNDREYSLSNINSTDSGYSQLEIFHEGYFECKWDRFNLTAGTYICSVFCSINGQITDWVDRAFELHVENGDYYGSGKFIGFQSKFLIPHSWSSHEL